MPIPLEMTADLPAFRKELDMEVMSVATENGYTIDDSKAAILAVAVTFSVFLLELRCIGRHRKPSFGEVPFFHTRRKQDFPSLRFSSLIQNSSHYLLTIHVTKGGGVMTSFSHFLAHVWAFVITFICFVRGVIAVVFPEVQAGTPAPDPNEGPLGERIKAYTDMSVSARRIWDCKNIYHRVAFPIEEMETAVRRAQRQRGIDFADVE